MVYGEDCIPIVAKSHHVVIQLKRRTHGRMVQHMHIALHVHAEHMVHVLLIHSYIHIPDVYCLGLPG